MYAPYRGKISIPQIFTIQFLQTLKLIIAITIMYYSALLLHKQFKKDKRVPVKSITDEQLSNQSG